MQLYSKRLILRQLTMEDAGCIAELANDPRIAQTTLRIAHPYTLKHAQDWIRMQQEAQEAGKEQNWAITLRDSGRVIGAIGLMINRNFNHAEMGFWLGVSYWKNGFTSEAAAMVLKFAFNKLHLNRVHAHHMAGNEASGKVLQRIGMCMEGVLRGHVQKQEHYYDIVCYGILSEEYEG